MKTRDTRSRPRPGPWFHSFDGDGAIAWQGKIVGEPQPGICLFQLFSWAHSEPTVQKIIALADMPDWSFYRTNAAMCAVGDRLVASWRMSQGGWGRAWW